jgi:hypothetical protein
MKYLQNSEKCLDGNRDDQILWQQWANVSPRMEGKIVAG